MMEFNKPIQTDAELDLYRHQMQVRGIAALATSFTSVMILLTPDKPSWIIVISILLMVIGVIMFKYYSAGYSETDPISGQRSIRVEALLEHDEVRNYVAKVVAVRELRNIDYLIISRWVSDEPAREGESATRRLNETRIDS